VTFRPRTFALLRPQIRRAMAHVPLVILFGSVFCRESRSDEIYITVGAAPAAQRSVPGAEASCQTPSSVAASAVDGPVAGAVRGQVGAPLKQPQEPERPQQRTIGPLKFESFRHWRWSPDTNSIHFDGPVKVTYTDPTTNSDSVMTATDLDYNGVTGRVHAPGISTITRADGRFQGYNIDFNLVQNVGTVENGVIVSDYFRMSGDRIEKLADGSYRLINGDFTTCIHGQPDYRLHVKDLTVRPDNFVRAHNVRLFLGGFPLPPIPLFSRNVKSASRFPFPTPGYDKNTGISLRLVDSPIDRKNETMDYGLALNLKRAPTGFLVYQHDLSHTQMNATPPRILVPSLSDPLSGLLELITPPTYREYEDNRYNQITEPRTTTFADLQNQQYVYNRRRTDLNVSRVPEAGIQFLNVLGRPFDPSAIPGSSDSTIPDQRSSGIGAAARYRTPNAFALLNVTAGLGEFIEQPTKVSSARLGFRANLASQPILLGRNLTLRAGVSEFLNFYSKGSIYQMLAPEAELDLAPTRDSLFNIGYRYLTDVGRTPFAFDRRDIRHELRLQYQVSGPWAFGIASKIDLERSRAYDGEIAIARNFDCMRVGVAYRLRGSSFNIIFSLIPPRKDKSRPLMPLHSRQ